MHRPIELLLITHHRGQVSGVERDWINAANALGPERAHITWAGISGTEALRAHVDPSVLAATLDDDFPIFSYLAHDKQYEARSTWRWAKILTEHLLHSVGPARRLMRRLRSGPFDLVVSGTSVVTAGALAARWRRLPHAWAVKEWLDSSRPACRRFARVVCSLSAVVIVPSSAVAKVFGGAAVIVPDGTDADRLPSTPAVDDRARLLSRLGLPLGLPLVVQCGTLSWWKGQHVTLEAMARLADTQARPAFSLLFLGGGDPTWIGHLRAMAARLPAGWSSVVRFDVVPPGSLGPLNGADLLVHPSVLPDPLPNAVREGMLLGKAVIASRSGGIPEMLTDGVSGLLVSPGDVPALAEAMSRLLADEALRSRLGHEARTRARSTFTSQVTSRRLDEVLRAAVRRSGRPQRARACTT